MPRPALPWALLALVALHAGLAGAIPAVTDLECPSLGLTLKADKAECGTIARDAPTERRLPLLVTGLPHSGLEELAEIGRRLELPLNSGLKEAPIGLADKGVASWIHAVSDLYYPEPYANLSSYRFDHVLLLVRHPLDTFASIAAGSSRSEQRALKFVRRHIPLNALSDDLTFNNLVLAAMYMFIDWNKQVLAVADHVLKAEHVDLRAVCHLYVTVNNATVSLTEAVKAKPTTDNPLSWEVLYGIDANVAERVKTMACSTFHYDCDVNVDMDSVAQVAKAYHPFVASLCARMKNEEPYVQEWVEFYRLAGVQRFIIYYDVSDDNTVELLQRLGEAGDIRIHPVVSLPGHEPGQQPFAHAEHSFRDACLEQNPDRVKWMVFLDGDEFLFPAQGKSLVQHLRKECRSDVSHLAIHSHFYGSSGLARRPAHQLTLEAYRAYSPYVMNRAGERRIVHKIVANTDCVLNMATHYPTRVRPSPACRVLYNVGGALSDETESVIDTDWGMQEHARCAKKLFLNHYVTKSREEFLGKYRKGKLSQATKEQEMDVDRDEFVRLMGDAFVEGGLDAIKVKFHTTFGTRLTEKSNPMARALLRFKHEFAFKDGHDRVGTEILKYVPDLERRLKENRIQLEGDAGVRYGSG